MAKHKRKRPVSVSPLVRDAEASVTKETRARQSYRLTRYGQKDFDGGVSLMGIRLERLACVKALEGLARKHPKRKAPFLQAYHLMAANAYHADLLAAEGHRNTAFRERVDTPAASDAGLTYRLDVSQKLTQISRRLQAEHADVLRRVISQYPDNSMTEIWPDRSARNKARENLKEALHQLALIYGLAKD